MIKILSVKLTKKSTRKKTSKILRIFPWKPNINVRPKEFVEVDHINETSSEEFFF